MTLHEWIRKEGIVVSERFLRVDGILNHRINPAFIEEAGRCLAEAFGDAQVTDVLTAEAAGNVIAYETARLLGAQAIYAKKGRATTMVDPLTRRIVSPTKGNAVTLAVSRDYLLPERRVLIVDDFLFEGRTSSALAEMVLEVGATPVGFGFVIAKEFASGRQTLARFGVPIIPLVCIRNMDPATGEIVFSNEASS